jgi:hypothetical protein
MSQEEDFETYEDFAQQTMIVEFADPEVDIDKLTPKGKKKQKGKKYCPNDGSKLKIRIDTKPNGNGGYILEGQSWVCEFCSYEEKIS